MPCNPSCPRDVNVAPQEKGNINFFDGELTNGDGVT